MECASKGLRSENRVGGFIIARLAAISLSTRDYRWLHERDWEDPQRVAYAELRQAVAVGAFSALPYEKNKRRTPAKVFGRWVLEFPQGTARAVAEVQVYAKSKFPTLHVLVSAFDGGAWRGSEAEALAMLVSALFVAAQADVIKVLPLAPRVEAELVALGWSEPVQVWTPYKLDVLLRNPELDPGVMLRVLVLGSHEWWASEQGKRSRATLSYLEKRVEAAKRAEAPPKAGKIRRGFLARWLTWR